MSRLWIRKWSIAVSVLLVVVGGSMAGCKKDVPPPEVPAVEPMPEPPPPVTPSPFDVRGLPSEVESRFRDVHFAYDSAALDAASQAILKDNFGTMQLYPGIRLEVEGHCDERGTSEYNMALGQRRATSVRDFLVRLGAQAEAVQTISYGEEVPLDPGHSEIAWAKNRRAHFRVVAVGP